MKKYGAMRFVAGLLTFVGWVVIIFGALIFLTSIFASNNVPTTEYVNQATVILAGSIVSAVTILSGIFTIAGGQMIAAQADIATNSTYLRMMAANISEIAANREKTVGFFEPVAKR